MRAVHRLLSDCPGCGIHCCLLLALHDHPAEMLSGQLPHRIGRVVRVLSPVVRFEFGKPLCDMLAQPNSARRSARHRGHAQACAR